MCVIFIFGILKIKRVYLSADKSDDLRILVDRLWPRGVSKQEAKIDLWLKDIAPSQDLRKWFGHDPNKWKEFQKRYRGELKGKKELLDQIRELEKKNEMVTLVFAAKDTDHNNAVVLISVLAKS